MVAAEVAVALLLADGNGVAVAAVGGVAAELVIVAVACCRGC